MTYFDAEIDIIRQNVNNGEQLRKGEGFFTFNKRDELDYEV